jgi:oligoribonuclease NrnB/cAMP/cGMP phosphodiesterase (DHH superfamily)
VRHLFIITHTDLDGVGSAAVYIRLSGVPREFATIIFAEPYNLHEVLSRLAGNVGEEDKIVLADLGPNESNFTEMLDAVKKLKESGAIIEWYDHHVCDPKYIEALRRVGVELYVDRSTCATGVVARYHPSSNRVDDVTMRIVKAVCAADLWIWDDPLAPKLFRVAGNRRDEEWKTRLIWKLSAGTLWDEELQARLEEYVNKELVGASKALKSVVKVGDRGRCLVVAAVKDEGPPSNSIIGALLLSRFNADIAVIIRRNGAVSLRSRDVDVQVVAKALGGGGHPRASGAKIEIPLIIRFSSLFSSRALSRYAARLIRDTALREGVCRLGKE